jgi:aminomethyltransferase
VGVVCELVIFDCDGVLIDSDRISLRVQAERLGELGLSLSYEECLRDFLGIGMRATLTILAERIGRPVPDSWVDGLDTAVRQAFLEELTTMPGIVEALDAIAGPTCIASSLRREHAGRSFDRGRCRVYDNGRSAGVGPGEPRCRVRRPSRWVRRAPASLRAMTTTPRRTALYDRHVDAGAKLVEFAGWEMPIQYKGVREEHMAVRENVGVFDVSHMGEIETAGPGAEALLQRLLSNDVAKIPIGGAQYSVLCREDGGVLDDLFTYRLEVDRYLTVTNAANHERDLAWFREHAKDFDEVEVSDRIDDYAMLAVQGPRARELVQAISDAPLPARMTAATRRLAGARVLVCGTGYTGEDGVELLASPPEAPNLWDELLRRGAVPTGLGARDTLRLEACYHLYGNDLSTERGPIEAGLGWCCKEHTGFIGSDAVAAVRSAGPAEKLIAFTIDGPGIARQGNAVLGGGEVTSGTFSPCLELGIGMAYVPAGAAAVGTKLEIDVRGRVRPATVAAKPLLRTGPAT